MNYKSSATVEQKPTNNHSLDANIIIANAPDPVFVSDLEGKILQANDAVSELLGFRQDEVLEQSLSRFISPEETREFTAALREVVERGGIRNTRLNPRSASGDAWNTDWPSTKTSPRSGAIRPIVIFSRTLFPEPEGPTIASSSPAATASCTSCSTGRSNAL